MSLVQLITFGEYVRRRDQRTALCHNRAARLKMDLLPWPFLQQLVEHGEIIIECRNRQVVRVVIVDAQAAAKVQVYDARA